MRNLELVGMVAADTTPQKGGYGVGGREHARRVARVYRTALRLGQPPRQAIAYYFDRSEKTASNWIAQARKLNELGSCEDEVAAARGDTDND